MLEQLKTDRVAQIMLVGVIGAALFACAVSCWLGFLIFNPPNQQAVPIPTQASEPTPTFSPEPTPTKRVITCDCSSNLYNCSDFDDSYSAQGCFTYCQSIDRGDVHELDRDGDGNACEWEN